MPQLLLSGQRERAPPMSIDFIGILKADTRGRPTKAENTSRADYEQCKENFDELYFMAKGHLSKAAFTYNYILFTDGPKQINCRLIALILIVILRNYFAGRKTLIF